MSLSAANEWAVCTAVSLSFPLFVSSDPTRSMLLQALLLAALMSAVAMAQSGSGDVVINGVVLTETLVRVEVRRRMAH